jgi:hypothetical protein
LLNDQQGFIHARRDVVDELRNAADSIRHIRLTAVMNTGAATDGALHGLAHLGRARHVAGRLEALAGEIDGGLMAAGAACATALAARNAEDRHG